MNGVWLIGEPADGYDETRQRVDAVFPTEEAAMAYINRSTEPDWFAVYRLAYVEYGEIPDDVFETAPKIHSVARLAAEAAYERKHQEQQRRNAEWAAKHAATARVEFPKAHVEAFRRWAAENGVEIEEKS